MKLFAFINLLIYIGYSLQILDRNATPNILY